MGWATHCVGFLREALEIPIMIKRVLFLRLGRNDSSSALAMPNLQLFMQSIFEEKLAAAFELC
jgi:hypothetical protein